MAIDPQVKAKAQRLAAYLAGSLLAAVASCAALLIVEWACETWKLQPPWLIEYLIATSPSLVFAVWAARRHVSFTVAVFAPLFASPVGVVSVVAFNEICFPDPSSEIAPWVVIFMLGPMLGMFMWFPESVAGVITVRVKRGRWQLRRAGHCQECDYNLAGLTGEKCPECGAVCRELQ